MTAIGKRRTLLVVEPHLEGQFGHPWRYAIAFAERFAKSAWSIRVLSHLSYTGPSNLGDMSITPVFGRSYFEQVDRILSESSSGGGGRPDQQSTGTVSSFLNVLLEEIERESSQTDDIRILIPTATTGILAELLALPFFLRGTIPRAALLFHEEPELYANWYRPLAIGSLQSRLAGIGWGRDLRCFATNAKLAEGLTSLLGIPVEGIGDVFGDGEIARLQSVTRTPSLIQLPSSEKNLIDELLTMQLRGKRVAWCPGQMRPDKGVGNLTAIVQGMERESTSFHLVLQSPIEEARKQVEIEALADRSWATVIRGALSDAGYDALLGIVDVLLLPYDRTIYARRVSHVLQEAEIANRPALASAGISAEDEKVGSAVAFVSDWTTWPRLANELIEQQEKQEPAEGKAKLTDKFTRWWEMTEWLTSSPSTSVPKAAVLYVRASQESAIQVDRCRLDLKHLASRGFPVFELLLTEGIETRSSILDQIADSLAQLTTWTCRPAKVDLLKKEISLFLSRLFDRRSVVPERQVPRSDIPNLIGQVRDRRGFSLVVVNGWNASEGVIRRHLELPNDVSVLIQSDDACGQNERAADRLEAAINRLTGPTFKDHRCISASL